MIWLVTLRPADLQFETNWLSSLCAEIFSAKITEDKKTTDQLYLLIILKERLHLSIGIHNYNDTFCSFRNIWPHSEKSLFGITFEKLQ